MELFENLFEEGRNRELYAARLSTGTRFLYATQNYPKDIDPGYYSADYVRAWITESMLRHHLEGTYGENWFAHPEAGTFLRNLWATGVSKENEDVAKMIGYKPFDSTLLIEQFLDFD